MIPDFQTIMLPMLNALNDDKILNAKEIRELMTVCFKITETEQNVKTPSGKQFLFYNRIAWAISYLKMAELINSPERGHYQISESGKKVLVHPPEKITVKILKTLPAFHLNRNQNKETSSIDGSEEELSNKTPDELIDIGMSQIDSELSNLLMSQIKSCSPYFFEQVVIDLLMKMGYGGSDIRNGEITKKSGDEGIDGIIKEDKLGLDKIYIQAKKWENTAGRPEIQKFVGALHGKHAKKGIFITTSDFSKEALEYARSLDITVVLINGEMLTRLMIEHDLGVTVKDVYIRRKIDTDYFVED